jgi:phosphate transport system substrate-binding protein
MILVTFFISIAVPALFSDHLQAQEVYRIGGAGLLSGHVETLHRLYEQNKKDCNFAVMPSDTAQGFKDLASGKVGMTIATRQAEESEQRDILAKGRRIKSRIIGSVSLAIVLNKKNPVNALTIDQIRAIFTGRTTDWKELGGPQGKIRVLAQPAPETGAGVAFLNQVLGGEAYAKDHQMVRSLSSLSKICSKDIKAIGYLPTSTIYFKDSAKKGMKVIAVKEKKDGPPLFPKYGATKKAFYPNSRGKDCFKGLVDYIDQQTM